MSVLGYEVNFLNRSSLEVNYFNEFVELLTPFDPTNTNKPELATGTRHYWNGFNWEYNSRPKSLFTYTFYGRLGRYYEGGSRTNVSSQIGYRIQPYASLAATASYNKIDLPSPWNTTEFWLAGAEADITFTNKLFWSTLFQYNEQSKNFNLNSRFQWRYAPASDIFLVYTNNERIAPLEGNIWSLTLKMTYWFNK